MTIDFKGEYRQLRTQGYPAALALDIARNQIRLRSRIAELGIEWNVENYCPIARWRQDGFNFVARRLVDGHGIEWDVENYRPLARWCQDGFDLVVRRLVDEHGWGIHGDQLGEFTNQWAPGAVRHRGGRGEFRWFIPADAGNRHALYERARTYGETWWYETVQVQAWRAGILLGESSLSGIESDSDEDDFTAAALELADEAIAEACEALARLCRAH